MTEFRDDETSVSRSDIRWLAEWVSSNIPDTTVMSMLVSAHAHGLISTDSASPRTHLAGALIGAHLLTLTPEVALRNKPEAVEQARSAAAAEFPLCSDAEIADMAESAWAEVRIHEDRWRSDLIEQAPPRLLNSLTFDRLFADGDRRLMKLVLACDGFRIRPTTVGIDGRRVVMVTPMSNSEPPV